MSSPVFRPRVRRGWPSGPSRALLLEMIERGMKLGYHDRRFWAWYPDGHLGRAPHHRTIQFMVEQGLLFREAYEADHRGSGKSAFRYTVTQLALNAMQKYLIEPGVPA